MSVHVKEVTTTETVNEHVSRNVGHIVSVSTFRGSVWSICASCPWVRKDPILPS